MAPRKRARAADGTFRSSGGSLTGGTGDVKPQWLTVIVTAPGGASDYSVVEFTVPRIIMAAANTAQIMEILRVDWYMGISNLGDNDVIILGYLSTRPIRQTGDATTLLALSADLQNSTVMAAALSSEVETTTGALHREMPQSVSMNDGNGNGTLVATSSMFATVGQFSDAAPSAATVKILYRMVNVGITEYVGIVQSQQ